MLLFIRVDLQIDRYRSINETKPKGIVQKRDNKTEREQTLMLAQVNISTIHRHHIQIMVGKTIDKRDYRIT